MISIGQVAIATFTDDEAEQFKEFRCEVGNSLIYGGHKQYLRSADAAKFAQVHPSFRRYYEAALAVLWQGKGIYRSGTESPVMAVLSMLPKEAEFIVVFKAISHE